MRRYLIKNKRVNLSEIWVRAQTRGRKFDTPSVPNHTLGIKCVVFWDGVSFYFSCVASFFCVCVSILVGPAQRRNPFSHSNAPHNWTFLYAMWYDQGMTRKDEWAEQRERERRDETDGRSRHAGKWAEKSRTERESTRLKRQINPRLCRDWSLAPSTGGNASSKRFDESHQIVKCFIAQSGRTKCRAKKCEFRG